MRQKHRLKDTEVPFFYNIMYRYEVEERKGYNFSQIDKGIRSIINLNNNQKSVSGIIPTNTICYSGGSKSVDFLRHIRNAFAHCNIISDDTKDVYTFYDEWHNQCTMKGSMNRNVFHKLINAIFETKDGKRHDKVVEVKSNQNKSKKKKVK
ncbi:MAG: hypothetical protein IJ197_02250 [Bacteroidaceae bacterium]|nr:hypothetical protein [Bacteroidaceae bacterium]